MRQKLWSDTLRRNVLFFKRLILQTSGKILRLSPRLAGGVMDPVDQRVKPVEVELSRNLQTYLLRLGLLPKTSSASSLSPPGKVSLSWLLSAALCWLRGVSSNLYRLWSEYFNTFCTNWTLSLISQMWWC